MQPTPLFNGTPIPTPTPTPIIESAPDSTLRSTITPAPTPTPTSFITPAVVVTPPITGSIRVWQQLYIEVDIRDRVFGGTTIKQKALFTDLNIHQDVDTGQTQLRMIVITRNFENANGAYGALISKDEIPYRLFELLANNDCVVDLTTGMPHAIRHLTAVGSPTWDQLMDATGLQLMYQGDFFQMLQFTQDVRLTPTIKRFILDADSDIVNKFR